MWFSIDIMEFLRSSFSLWTCTCPIPVHVHQPCCWDAVVWQQQASRQWRTACQSDSHQNKHTHTHVCACINMQEPCTHAPGCYLGKKTFTLIKKCMSFVLSEININEEVWFGMGGCSLITRVCVLVFAEEDAGKAGRVWASEQNTNVAAYLCSVPALTFLWSHSHTFECTGRAGEEIIGCGHNRITVLSVHRACK